MCCGPASSHRHRGHALRGIPGSSLPTQPRAGCFGAALVPPPPISVSGERECTTHAEGRGRNQVEELLFCILLFSYWDCSSFLCCLIWSWKAKAHIYLLCVFLGFITCEITFISLKSNITGAVPGWRDRNKVVKGLSMPIQLGSLFSDPACGSPCVSGFHRPFSTAESCRIH